MGINGLHDLLRKYCKDIYITKKLSEYSYQKVAIDTTLYLFKYKAVFGENWLNGFITLISSLRKNDIHCIFIEDGKAPIEKSGERQKRAEQKEKLDKKIFEIENSLDKYHKIGEVDEILIEVCKHVEKSEKVTRLLGKSKDIFNIKIAENYFNKIKSQSIKITSEDFKIVEELFAILGIPYFKSPSEAETFCCYLAKHKIVDAVLSEDTDVLAYGAPLFLTKINTSDETVVEMNFDMICKRLELSTDSFRDLCIMCGNDYNDNIPKIGPDRSFKLIRQYQSIEEIEKNTNLDISVLKYQRTRELFSIPEDFQFKVPYCEKADLEKLREFFFKNNIRYNISYLIECFKEPEIVFEE